MLKKLKKNNYDWTANYIKEYNEMVFYYEKQIEEKNKVIEDLNCKIEKIQKESVFGGKQKQISDEDISLIRKLKKEGKSYSYIAKETGWSKATISRVINNKKDIY